MLEINTFKTYTSNALIKAQESRDWLRSVWAPSCPFHGNQHFGNDSESLKYQVPAGSGTTLGKTLFDFNFAGETEYYIDAVDWPGNAACS